MSMVPGSILVVEDEQIVAMDLEATLRGFGYQVASVYSGEDAVDWALRHHPSLILMDIRLQGALDGVRAARLIRSQVDVPIIFLTAYADEATRERARDTTPYGYLVKPFDERTLETTVEMALVRHRHDTHIKLSEQWFRTTLASIGDAVITTDSTAQVTYVNASAARLIGAPPSEAIGRPVASVLPLYDPETSEPVAHPIHVALAKGAHVPMDQAFLLRKPGAQDAWIDDSVAPIKLDPATTIGAVMVFRDATERRRAEQAQRESQRRREEIRHLERLRVLSGGAAHDLNNLLAGLLGYAELARLDSGDRALVDESLGHIERICRRASELTQHLLAYAGLTHLAVRPVDLGQLVNEVVGELSASLLRTLPITLSLPDEPAMVSGDPGHLHQIALNLVVNAAEALADGDGELTIAVGERTVAAMPATATITGIDLPAGQYVALEVADTGVGMDEATRSRIFEPFFSTKFTGRGLGLAAVIGNVRAHGGTILVDSAPGAGTRFTVILPAAGESAQPAAPVPAASDWRGSGTVLVIDDEEDVCAVSRQLLDRIGFDAVAADGGRTGIERFVQARQPFAAVLLDLTMPQMSGIDVALRLRAIDPRIPILLMSGYSQDDALERVVAANRLRFLPKPFTLEALRAQLRQALECGGQTGVAPDRMRGG
ncbi:MAG TPA: response regulator [Herpetosiphonaceae bacterium]|nr:response regulator [Herpetosiphonaceae bacterium]